MWARDLGTSDKTKSSSLPAIVAVVVVLAIVVGGFIPFLTVVRYVPNAYATTSNIVSPYSAVETTQIAYTQTSTSVQTQQAVSTQIASVWNIAPLTLQGTDCSTQTCCVSQRASLNVGEDVQVSFSASSTVDVYVLNSAEYAGYSCSALSAGYIVSGNGQASDTFSFPVSATDSYYLVVFNPHGGFFGLGATPVGLLSATGTGTQQVTVTSYNTITNTNVAFSTTTTTVTLYSTSTTTFSATSTQTSTQTVGIFCKYLNC